MTVTTETYRTEHSGNGTTFVFSTGFPFETNEEVRVVMVNDVGSATDWTEGVHYTLTGAGTGTAGTITVSTSPTNYTPQTGETLVVLHKISLLQTLDADVLSTLAAKSLETALDRIYRAMQMLQEQIDRTIMASVGGDLQDMSGWTPICGIESDGDRRVLKIVDWTGGSIDKPPADVYIGSSGFVSSPSLAVDLRGPTGPTGPGTGDLLSTNNLSDLANISTARANLQLNLYYAQLAMNLSDLPDASAARANIGANNADNLTTGTVNINRLPKATAAQFRNNTADRLLAADTVWSAASFVTLTDAATISINMNQGFNFTVTIAGNRTLANPSNAKPGQTGMIEVVQDATGGRTLAFGSRYKFNDGVVPTIPSAANAKCAFAYYVRSTTEIWMSMPVRSPS